MNKLVIGILNCDRGIEISLLMYSLLEQTYQDFDIIIIDDNSNNFLYENTTFKSLLKLHENLNHKVKIIKGKRKGPSHSGQLLFENSNDYDIVLRLDDDVTLQSDCIEKLIDCFNDKEVVAAGPIYLLPFLDISKQTIDLDMIKNSLSEISIGDKISNIYLINDNEIHVNGSLQMNVLMNADGNIPVKHLHSGFMYKRSSLEDIGGYFLGYSKVSHREETDTSYRLFLNGGKLVVCPDAISFHFHPSTGGIRTDENGQPNDTKLWEDDEKIFIERFKNNFNMDNINNQETINDRRKKYNMKTIEKLNKSIRPNFHIVTVTYGNHKKLEKLIESFDKYTDLPYIWIIVNNDPSEKSRNLFSGLIEKWDQKLPIIDIQLEREMSVSDARNIGANHRKDNIEYICFVDDDALVLGKWSKGDWLDVMYKELNKERDIGAVSPIHTWFEPLKSHVLSVACLMVPVKVWEQVGGFDPIFGNKEKGTWGYEDTDWSYRLQSMGYIIKGIPAENFPFYHEDTTGKKKADWQETGLLKAKELLLLKHKNNIELKNNIHITILTYGDHHRLQELLKGLIKYTNKPYSVCVVNNDSNYEYHCKLKEIIDSISNNLLIQYINLDKEITIGEARNIGVKNRPKGTEYICFIDDDSHIIGQFTNKDWLRQLQDKFCEERDTGSVSPFYFWYDPLKFYTSTSGCFLTSINIWNQIGGFDSTFGKNNTWGYEDTDWFYRLFLSGYKIKDIDIENFPYFHPSDDHEDIENKRPKNRLEKRVKAEKLLLSKYDIDEIQKFGRVFYPFTKEQMETKGKKLNIGCYYMKLDGFINIDINPKCEPDILGSILDVDFDNESIDLILASQVIEHFDLVDDKYLFSKFYNWLKTGGHLIIEVPDVGKILDMVDEQGEDIAKYYEYAIYGNQHEIGMKHKSQFDNVLLKNMLKEAGFNNITRNDETSDNDDITLRFDIKK